MIEQKQRPSVGMDVIDNADHLVGTVETVENDHFVVQKGFFFPQSHTVSMSAIDAIVENEVILRISREEVTANNVNVDWTAKPHYGEHIPDNSEKLRSGVRGGFDPRNLGT